MKKAFICSAYRGDVEKNTERARRYCLAAIDSGYAPFAPHLLYPQFLRDESGADRCTGIQCGLEFMRCCDIVLVFGAITAGMHTEIEEAKRLGVEVEYIARQSETEKVVCPDCNGSGVYQEYDEYDRYYVHACGKCDGSGEIARQSATSEEVQEAIVQVEGLIKAILNDMYWRSDKLIESLDLAITALQAYQHWVSREVAK